MRGFAEDGSELDNDTVEKVVGRFDNLNVYTISDAELPTEPTARLTWTDDNGEATISLYHLEEEDDWGRDIGSSRGSVRYFYVYCRRHGNEVGRLAPAK